MAPDGAHRTARRRTAEGEGASTIAKSRNPGRNPSRGEDDRSNPTFLQQSRRCEPLARAGMQPRTLGRVETGAAQIAPQAGLFGRDRKVRSRPEINEPAL